MALCDSVTDAMTRAYTLYLVQPRFNLILLSKF